MLADLCGNQNIARILIFLLVNERCYGTQLQRLLDIPLTPVQKALQKLEKTGVVTSFFEGKTRLYQLNPAYPLHSELESLIKKAYSLLPMQEKKRYSFVQRKTSEILSGEAAARNCLLAIWQQLGSVTRLSFQARMPYGNKGKGEVLVTRDGPSTLLFQEQGNWRSEEGKLIDFRNVFRWSLDLSACMLSLEHLRHGPNRPVFLFHLIPSGTLLLESKDAHLCGDDTYFGRLYSERGILHLTWRILGPTKNEEIHTFYN